MSTWIRLFSLDEANALIPELETLTAELRRAHKALHSAAAHVADLEIVWGEQVKDPSCPDHGEYLARDADVKAKRLAVHTAMERIKRLGVEVKDPDTGLLDFYALNGDKLVYLCWKSGEGRIEAWHTLRGGFAARRPLPEFMTEGPSQ